MCSTSLPSPITNVASNEGNSSAAGSGAESAALFSKLRSFSIGSGPNSPQRVVSNLRGFLTHRLSNITPSDTEKPATATATARGLHPATLSHHQQHQEQEQEQEVDRNVCVWQQHRCRHQKS
ncbi:hypothetical protein ACLKA6_009599 [Drosophila palustris]